MNPFSLLQRSGLLKQAKLGQCPYNLLICNQKRVNLIKFLFTLISIPATSSLLSEHGSLLVQIGRAPHPSLLNNITSLLTFYFTAVFASVAIFTTGIALCPYVVNIRYWGVAGPVN